MEHKDEVFGQVFHCFFVAPIRTPSYKDMCKACANWYTSRRSYVPLRIRRSAFRRRTVALLAREVRCTWEGCAPGMPREKGDVIARHVAVSSCLSQVVSSCVVTVTDAVQGRTRLCGICVVSCSKCCVFRARCAAHWSLSWKEESSDLPRQGSVHSCQ